MLNNGQVEMRVLVGRVTNLSEPASIFSLVRAERARIPSKFRSAKVAYLHLAVFAAVERTAITHS